MSPVRCNSLDPVGLIGRNVQCDLTVGHTGRHKATRKQDDWESTAFWNQDPIDDELRALRKVAAAAATYLEHSRIKEPMHWPQQLTLHNALAHYRNVAAAPPKAKKRRAVTTKGQAR